MNNPFCGLNAAASLKHEIGIGEGARGFEALLRS